MNLVKIFNDAGATLGRIIQQAEEVFLDVPKTKYNDEYLENIKKIDFLIILTERLIADAEQFLNPNAEVTERWIPLEEFGNTLQNPVLGLKDFSESFNDDLFKAGKYQKKLAFSMKNFKDKSIEKYVQKLKNILEVDLKNFKDEEAALEHIRLDHDYLKNRVDNAFTSAGKEALEKEYEKTRAIFEKHYDSTIELFKSADSYFTLHRQLLKEFIDIERNYYRECEKNLTILLRKLHCDSFKITYDLQFDHDGFISTSDVDERIRRKKIIELSKLSENPEMESNKFSPIDKHGGHFEKPFQYDNDVMDSEISVRRINGSVECSSQGFPIDESDHHVITNGIYKSYPLRVVMENENEGKALDSSANASSGNDDEEEHLGKSTVVLTKHEIESETPELPCFLKIEKSEIEIMPLEEGIKIEDPVMKESTENQFEDTMMSSKINFTCEDNIQAETDPSVHALPVAEIHLIADHAESEHSLDSSNKLELNIHSEAAFDPNLSENLETKTHEHESIKFETDLPSVSLKMESSLPSEDQNVLSKETFSTDVHGSTSDEKANDIHLNVALDHAKHDEQLNIEEATVPHSDQKLESTAPENEANINLTLQADLHVDQKLDTEGEEGKDLSIHLGKTDDKNDIPNPSIEGNVVQRNKFGWNGDSERSKKDKTEDDNK